MSDLKVLSVASEVYPLVKTGGLADVTGALPGALAREGVKVRTLVPGYPEVMSALEKPRTVIKADLFGADARILAGKAAGLDLLAIDAPHLYARPGNPYLGPDGRDWPDNLERFAALGQIAARIGLGELRGYRPDIVHAHDWQAGLAPAYLHYAGRAGAKTVATIHNIAFQGSFPAARFGLLGLPPTAYSMNGVEFWGQVSFLKAGLQFADRITTVSPQYAVEIRSPEAGMGFEGLLRARSSVVSGILNGIDTEVWNPAEDASLPQRYDAKSLDLRVRNKDALQKRAGLPAEPDTLLFGVVSRLSWQKGIDILLDALPALVRAGAQLVMLGSGDKALEERLSVAQAVHPKQIGVTFGYDEALAHLIQGGADALLVPSRFEPCGLTQLCALRYGSVPVVSRVGGLVDTIIDAGEMALASGVATGVQFAPVDRDTLEVALRKTLQLWRDRGAWRQMQANGMATDVSWKRPARHYADLYRGLIAGKG